ncbi:MAG: hypothetical protein HYZ43_05805 [Flavobacteriia bacterium]|nr:hypothetical protein [Flavobacteriia bacterium]
MRSTVSFFAGISLLTILLTGCGDSSEEKLQTKADVYLAEAAQSTAMDHLNAGNQHYYAFQETTMDRSLDPGRMKRVNESFKAIKDVNKLCEESIRELEKYKQTLLKQVGINSSRDIERAYMPYNDPITPATYSLRNLAPNKKLTKWVADGNTLFALRQQFRKEAMQLFMKHSADISGNSLNATVPIIESFNNERDLQQQIDRAFQPINIRYDDVEFAKHLYKLLSDDKSTYLGYFKTTPSWITQFQLLTVCETEILAFRRDYFSFISSTVNLSSEYNFNQLVTVVEGPNTATAGSTIKLKVFVAGHNNYRLPMLFSDTKVQKTVTENGYDIITYTVPNASEVTYTGKTGVYSKSGVLQMFPWSKTITIVK